MNLSHKTELTAYSAGPFIRPTTYKTGLFLHHFWGRNGNQTIAYGNFNVVGEVKYYY